MYELSNLNAHEFEILEIFEEIFYDKATDSTIDIASSMLYDYIDESIRHNDIDVKLIEMYKNGNSYELEKELWNICINEIEKCDEKIKHLEKNIDNQICVLYNSYHDWR